MIINQKILHLPPYISTSWKNISALHLEEKESKKFLYLTLNTGQIIEIPHLEQKTIDQIFEMHGQFLKGDDIAPQGNETLFSFGLPLKPGLEGIELGSIAQHNSEQKNSPPLPPEILNKIASVAKAIGMNVGGIEFPEAEPHCNCPYCQIARTIYGQDAQEEEISDEDLKFRDWEVRQEATQLYNVINPLDQAEHYQVYLGNPLGCTCGKENCEHIRAVLNS